MNVFEGFTGQQQRSANNRFRRTGRTASRSGGTDTVDAFSSAARTARAAAYPYMLSGAGGCLSSLVNPAS
jgi:hypothetical protein